MKYHNFKRPLAVILASLLTFSSASFVASAQETGEETTTTPEITYTLKGEKSTDGDYVISITATGGLINVGTLEIEYADIFNGASVKFEAANNIVDASDYWGYDGDLSDGKAEIAFMSSAGLSDDDIADLFAENESGTIAYIDASKDNIDIGTLTFSFAEGESYDTTFVTGNANGSDATAKFAKAQVIIHEKDGYNTEPVDVADVTLTNTLVFTAKDFTVTNTETTYNGNAQKPTVTSDVAEVFTLDLNGATEQTDADTYAIKVKNVSGEGYYDAAEIDLAKNFVIATAEVDIAVPANPENVTYVKDGFNPQNIKYDDWSVVDTTKLNVGSHELTLKYSAEVDTANNIYFFNDEDVTDALESEEGLTTKVTLVVEPAKGEVPELVDSYTAVYNSAVDQTIEGYGFELSQGWTWDNTTEVGMESKNVTVTYTPDDAVNYDYSKVDGWDGAKVVRTVSVVLTKAEGTAPALPVVTASVRRDTLDTVIKASNLVTNAGVWSYTDADLTTGDNTIAFTYKPTDLDKVDYEGLANWNAETEQFEYSVTVKVLAPYFDPTGIYPPTNPVAVNFEEGKTFTAADFALETGWEYAVDTFEITSAGTTEDIKVLYEIPAGYDGIDPEETEYTVEDGNIVYYVDLTVNRIAIPDGAITFSQTSDYTGSAIVLEKANIAITGLTGVTADNVTLVAVADVDAGTYDVLATVAETTNYNAVTTAVKIGTLTITPAEVTADKFTLEYTTVEYDGNAKMPTVTATAGVGAVATVKYYNNAGTEVETPTDYGTYTVKVSGPANGNYKEYTDFEVGTFSITKHQVTITAPTALDPVNYVPGGYDLANLVVTGWTVVTTGKLNAGEHDVTIAYNGDFDTTNYSYIYNGEEVTDKAAITATLKLTVNKGRIIIQKPEVGYDVDYVEGGFDLSTVKIDGWTTISTQKVGAGKSAITVEYAGPFDTNNYEYEFDGATVTYPPRAYPIIIVRKINLPADPLKIDDNDFTYNGSAQKATVSLKNTLTGVDEILVTYKQGETVVADPTDAGIYDVYVTVEESNNYYGLDETKLGSYEIKKATVEKTDITVADTEHTYDGNKKAPTATSAKGGTAVVTVTGEAINAGTYTFTVSGEATTNYEAYSFTYENGLVIKKADVKKDVDFTVSDTSLVYDGNEKTPKVTKNTEGIGDPTVAVNGVAIDVGTYTFTVSGPSTPNYNEYTIEYTNGFEITKAIVTIAKPGNLGATDYVPGGVLASGLTYPANWAYNDETDKMLEAGVDQAIKVKYTATLDTANNDYVAGEGVEGDATNGFTSTVTITVNQIAGTIPALTTSYEVTYDKEKADKKVTTYVTIESADWVLTDKEAVLEYKADNKYAVETVLDTKNYTYAAVQGVTVGEGKATAEITVKFNKATLPTDAAKATSKTTEYTGSAITVEVAKNEDYNGLGEFTVAYPEGNINVGTYDVTATFAEGENYLGDTITFTDALTITKQVLQNISAPTFNQTEAIVGDVISGDAGEGFTFVESYTIEEGNNELKVTKTIAGSFAKNYDYTEAAAKVGLTVTIDETTGDVTLSKTFNVTGKYSTGTLNLTVNTDSAQTADANTGDVTITILPEGGTAYELATDKFTESADVITVADLVLTEGKYTITVKKQKYLAYVLTLNVTANSTTEKTISLVAGDIVGGEEGKEIMGDGVIDIDDFVIAIRAFDDASSDAVKDAADIDENNANNVTDLGFIKANFNKTTAGNCTEDTTITNG